MGRRLFGATSISRLVSAFSAKNARAEREELIAQSTSTAKELPIKYQLTKVEFDPETRLTSITIKSIKTYRTIERYVTQNYVRYPVYSYWKTKTTNIDKKLKLTNKTLETLNVHDDELIRQFASEIVLGINNPELIPSWLAEQIIENDYLTQLATYNKEIGEHRASYNRYLADSNIEIKRLSEQNALLREQYDTVQKKISRIQHKINYIDTHKCSIVICIITFGIYALLFTKSRRNRLDKKINGAISVAENIANEIDSHNKQIQDIKDKQKSNKDAMNHAISGLNKSINKLVQERLNQLKEVTKLDTYLPDNNFVPLKRLIGAEYEKIIGCYVIHNKENDRYYVGQSKDVMKRLKQHFRGTVPNNIIFAEDYYKSTYNDKADIFEVKIIPLSTKDELDKTEAKLIEEYESNVSGYNSTKGNS